jgi:hypothetical protein
VQAAPAPVRMQVVKRGGLDLDVELSLGWKRAEPEARAARPDLDADRSATARVELEEGLVGGAHELMWKIARPTPDRFPALPRTGTRATEHDPHHAEHRVAHKFGIGGAPHRQPQVRGVGEGTEARSRHHVECN